MIPPTGTQSRAGQLSEDGHWRWDGQQWQPADTAISSERRRGQRRSIWARFWALSFLLIAVVLVFNAWSGVAANLSQPPPPIPPNTGNEGFTLTFEAQRFLESDRKLEGVLRLHLDSSRLIDHQTAQPLQTCSTCLKASFANRDVRVYMLDQRGSAAVFAYPIPLSYFYSGNAFGTINNEDVRPAAISLVGDPDLYPDDTYRFGINIGASVQDSDVLRAGTLQSEAVNHFDFGSIHGWTFRTVSTGKGGGELEDVIASRVQQTTTYVHVFALVPMAFFLLFVHLLFFNPTTRTAPLGDFLIALSASTLAILPLRAVLVPPQLQGITRADFFLGLGMVLLVALAMVRYAWDLWSYGRPGAGGESDGAG